MSRVQQASTAFAPNASMTVTPKTCRSIRCNHTSKRGGLSELHSHEKEVVIAGMGPHDRNNSWDQLVEEDWKGLYAEKSMSEPAQSLSSPWARAQSQGWY